MRKWCHYIRPRRFRQVRRHSVHRWGFVRNLKQRRNHMKMIWVVLYYLLFWGRFDYFWNLHRPHTRNLLLISIIPRSFSFPFIGRHRTITFTASAICEPLIKILYHNLLDRLELSNLYNSELPQPLLDTLGTWSSQRSDESVEVLGCGSWVAILIGICLLW